MAAVVVADSMAFTPAATAAVACPARMPLCPRWAATSDDEQAVSVLTQGPCKVTSIDSDQLQTDWAWHALACCWEMSPPVDAHQLQMKRHQKLNSADRFLWAQHDFLDHFNA